MLHWPWRGLGGVRGWGGVVGLGPGGCMTPSFCGVAPAHSVYDHSPPLPRHHFLSVELSAKGPRFLQIQQPGFGWRSSVKKEEEFRCSVSSIPTGSQSKLLFPTIFFYLPDPAFPGLRLGPATHPPCLSRQESKASSPTSDTS